MPAERTPTKTTRLASAACMQAAAHILQCAMVRFNLSGKTLRPRRCYALWRAVSLLKTNHIKPVFLT